MSVRVNVHVRPAPRPPLPRRLRFLRGMNDTARFFVLGAKAGLWVIAVYIVVMAATTSVPDTTDTSTHPPSARTSR